MTAPFDPSKLQVLIEQLEGKSSALDKFMSDNQALFSGLDEKSKQVLAEAEKQAKSINEITSRLVELEQKAVDHVMGGKQSPNRIGDLLIKSNQFTQFVKDGKSGRVRFEVKADPLFSGSSLPSNENQTVKPPQSQIFSLLDVIPAGTTSSGSVTYPRESVWENNAASQKEGATKKESKLRFKQITDPVVTIAHLLYVSKQTMDDAPQLAAYINNRMEYGLKLEIERQILHGLGQVTNNSNHDADEYAGIMTAGNHAALVADSDDTNIIDVVNTAIYQAWDSDYQPDATIMHPRDWSKIEKTKDKQDRYIFGAPGAVVQPVLWGVPVALSAKQTRSKFATGAFKLVTQRLVREDVTLEIFEQDGDNVAKNMLTIRAEERSVLQNFAPAGIVAGELAVGDGTGG